MKLTLTLLAIGMLGALLLWYQQSPGAAVRDVLRVSWPAPDTAGATAALATAAQGAAPAQPGLPAAAWAPRPAERNRVFRTDAAGELVIDDAVAERLESLLATLPPHHGLAALEQVEEAVREGLPARQALQALELLHRYLAYQRAEALLLAQPRSGESVEAAQEMFNRVVVLRREYFDAPLVDALFAAREAQTRSVLGLLARRRGH